jgi:hypothetical protein
LPVALGFVVDVGAGDQGVAREVFGRRKGAVLEEVVLDRGAGDVLLFVGHDVCPLLETRPASLPTATRPDRYVKKAPHSVETR